MILRNVSARIFADTPELEAAAQAAASDPRLSRSRIEVHGGGIAGAAQWLAGNSSPDVLILGDCVDELVWERLETLAENVEPHCRVILVGPQDNIAIYREMTGRGIADYLGGPPDAAEIAEALCRLFAEEDALPKGRLVVVLPAVGGAGGSTLAAALATTLGERLGEAVLLDMDLGEGTAALMMGVDPREPVAAALANPGLDAAMLERFMVREGKVRVLSTAGSLRDARFVDGDTIERLVNVARGMAKVTIVDMPKGWGESHQRLMTLADEVVVVSKPDLASLRNTRMIVDDVASRRIDGKRPKVVLNQMGAARKNEFGVADFAESGGTNPAAAIPFDPEPLATAIAEGRPVAQSGGKAMTSMLEFAETILVGDGDRKAAKKKANLDPLAMIKARLEMLRPKPKNAKA